MSHMSPSGIDQRKKVLAELLQQGRPSETYAASLAQRRLWFLEQLQGSSAAYNVHVGLWLDGPLDVASLRASLQEIVNRHDSLRTAFRLEGGELLQVVIREHTVDLPVIDVTFAANYAEAYEIARREVENPFDLSRAPLFRARLLRYRAEAHIFLCTMHHVVTDAWSMQIFAKELFALYEAFSKGRPSPLPPLPIGYGDYSEWQLEWFGTDKVQQELTYWKSRLEGAPAVLDLPTDRPRPAEQTFDGASQYVPISSDIIAGIKMVAARYRATPFMVLLAAFKVLLYRYSGQPDVLVGVPVAGRSQMETENLIGFFVNTLVMRDDLSGNPRFIDLVAQVRETTLGAYANAEVPFEKVVELVQPERNLSCNPIFQVMFSAIKSAVQSHTFGNLTAFPYIVSPTTSMFDLSMTVIEGIDGQWWAQIDYNTNLFDSLTIERMQEHFRNLLRGITAGPGQPIGELPLLGAAEEERLLVELNDTATQFRPDVCLHTFFEQQVLCTPDAVAVVCGAERISYRQLNQRADGLAAYLRQQGAGPEVLVGLCADRSLDLLVGVLGILKAGAAYVPLDPAYPEQRLNRILEDAHATILVTQQKFKENFSERSLNVMYLDRDWTTIESEHVKSRAMDACGDNLAYVLFTSGSTGRPKGVALEHRNAANFVQWAQTVFTPQELAGTLFATSICFDLSIFELFVPWSVGGTVILAQDVISLPELPASKEVTLINTVPSAMAELVRAGVVPASVVTVNLAGEALPKSLARDLYERTQVRNVYNLYGPTEAATYATFAPVSREADVTIGGPIANTQAYILDSYRRLVPRGVRGELYLGGECLARGYFGRPDLTAERFVGNPFSKRAGARLYRTGDLCRYRQDGRIEYLGRLDHQVKLRGFRIELGEIEAVLEQHDFVQQAIATVRESGGEKRLVGYVEVKPGRPLPVAELRRHAEQSLPLYMVPETFVILDEFPRTVNGKVDRSALPAPGDRASTGAVAPSNELEATLKQIWETALGGRPIGIKDNFFDLGGHSLLAARLIAQLHDALGQTIPLSAIFRAPTIEGFARLLTDESIVKPDPIIMQLGAGTAGQPFFAVAAPGVDTFGLALLAHQMGKEQSTYKLQALGPVVLDRPFRKEELCELARESIAAMRSVQPRGPYYLGGMCEGVLIAQQMILELEAQGEEVALFTIFDTWVLENSQIRLFWAVDYYLQRFRFLRSQPWREQLATLWKAVRRLFWPSPAANGSGWNETYWPGKEFQVPRFKAPVLLFKRPRQPFHYVNDPQMGWGDRSMGGVEICEIKCGHLEVLREPYVRIVGQILGSHLQTAKDQESQSKSVFTADKEIDQVGVSNPSGEQTTGRVNRE